MKALNVLFFVSALGGITALSVSAQPASKCTPTPRPTPPEASVERTDKTLRPTSGGPTCDTMLVPVAGKKTSYRAVICTAEMMSDPRCQRACAKSGPAQDPDAVKTQ